MKKSNAAIFPLLLVLYEVATYLSNDAYLPALPNIVKDLATTNHLAQLTLTTWFLGTTSMQLILGPVSERYGRRPVLLFGGVVFILSTLVCTFTNNITIMLLSRFAQGTAIPSVIVAGYATIHELFNHEKAIHTLAWMYSITVLAPALGPIFGASILLFASWRWIFAILLIWAIAIVSVIYWKMPETNPHGYLNPIKIKTVVRQYLRILSNINYMRYTLSYCFLFGALIAWITASPFLIISEFHLPAISFGISQGLIFCSYILGTQLVKPIMRKFQSLNLISIGLTLSLCGGILSSVTWIFPHALWCLVVAMMLIAGGAGFSSPQLNRFAVESSSEPMGARVAMYSSLMSLFGFIASALISTIYSGTLGSVSIILLLLTAISFALNSPFSKH